MSCPRFHNKPTSVSDIHKRSRWRLIKCQTICRWHFIILYVVHDVITSASDVRNDLVKLINELSFNPDLIKQAQEIIFTRKISKENHPQLVFEP